MEWKDIQAWLDEHKPDEEVAKYLAGAVPVTAETAKAFLESEEGKKLTGPMLDSHFSRGLQTWKDNNLDKLVVELHDKKFPPEDDRDKENRDLKERMAKLERDALRSALRADALKVAAERGLPIDVIDHFIAEDEPTTTANLTKLEQSFGAAVAAEVEKRLKTTPKPKDGDGQGGQKSEINPWKKDTWNLTEQGRLVRDEPERAAKMKAEAGVK